MVSIAVTSDTHLVGEASPPALESLLDSADIVFHCGDFHTMDCYDGIGRRYELKAVHGNVDQPGLIELLPERRTIEIEGVRFGLVHRGGNVTGDVDPAVYLAREMGVDVLFIGHWHFPVVERRGDIAVMCPGSPTEPRQSDPTAIMLEVEGGNWEAAVVPLGEGRCDYIRMARGFGFNRT